MAILSFRLLFLTELIQGTKMRGKRHRKHRFELFLLLREKGIELSILHNSFFPLFPERILHTEIHIKIKLFRIFFEFFLKKIDIPILFQFLRERFRLIPGMQHGQIIPAICRAEILSIC